MILCTVFWELAPYIFYIYIWQCLSCGNFNFWGEFWGVCLIMLYVQKCLVLVVVWKLQYMYRLNCCLPVYEYHYQIWTANTHTHKTVSIGLCHLSYCLCKRSHESLCLPGIPLCTRLIGLASIQVNISQVASAAEQLFSLHHQNRWWKGHCTAHCCCDYFDCNLITTCWEDVLVDSTKDKIRGVPHSPNYNNLLIIIPHGDNLEFIHHKSLSASL